MTDPSASSPTSDALPTGDALPSGDARPSGDVVSPGRAGESEPVAFRLRRVAKTYPGQSAPAVGPASLDVPAGARVAVLGPSGAGKSTLVHLLGALDEADPPTTRSSDQTAAPGEAAGVTYFDAGGCGPGNRDPGGSAGDPVAVHYAAAGPGALARLRRRAFGFVFQQGHLLDHLTAAENVALGLRLAGVAAAERAAAAADRLRAVGMGDLVHRKARDLSGGQRQRVAVLRALAHDPAVVLADEPTSNLDPASEAAVLAALRAWQAGGTADAPRTLLLVTHDHAAAAATCDRFLLVRGGADVVGPLPADALPAPPPAPAQDDPDAGDPDAGDPDAARRAVLAATLAALTAPAACVAAPADVRTGAPRPGGGVRVRDLLSLAWRNTVRRENLSATAVQCVVLGLLGALCLLGDGMLTAKRAVMERELDVPAARRLDFTRLTDGDLLTPAAIEEANATFAAAETADGRPLAAGRPAVFPWSPDQRLFHKAPAANDPSAVAPAAVAPAAVAPAAVAPAAADQYAADQYGGPDLTEYQFGRTVAAGDPAISAESLVYLPDRAAGAGFSGPSAREVIVSVGLLTDAGRTADARTLPVDVSGATVPLTIVGVYDAKRSGITYPFFLPAGLAADLRTGRVDPDPLVGAVRLAGLPDDPALTARAVALAGTQLKVWVDASAEPDGTVRLGVFEGRVQKASRLRDEAEFLLELLSEPAPDGVPTLPADARVRIVPEVPADDAAAAPTSYGRASAYVADYGVLKEAADRLTADGFQIIDPRFVDLARRLKQVLGPLETMLWTLAACCVAVVALSLINALWQRVRARRRETAVLKACGMRRGHLLSLYGLEGAALAACAGLLAVAASLACGTFLNAANDQATHALAPPPAVAPRSAEGTPPAGTPPVQQADEPTAADPTADDAALYRFRPGFAALACGCGALIGAVAGLVAAWRSAAEHPADAVR